MPAYMTTDIARAQSAGQKAMPWLAQQKTVVGQHEHRHECNHREEGRASLWVATTELLK